MAEQRVTKRIECDGCSRSDVPVVAYTLSCDPPDYGPANYCESCAAHDRKMGITLTRFPVPEEGGR